MHGKPKMEAALEAWDEGFEPLLDSDNTKGRVFYIIRGEARLDERVVVSAQTYNYARYTGQVQVACVVAWKPSEAAVQYRRLSGWTGRIDYDRNVYG